MILILKPGLSKIAVEQVAKKVSEEYLVQTDIMFGVDCSTVGLIGDTSNIDMGKLELNENVERVMRVSEPYKKANRHFHSENTIVEVLDRKIGDKKLAIMAGPCSVESEKQLVSVAKSVKESGAGFLRGGAFKPRTSPYSFQGLGEEGLELLVEARRQTGLPIVSEIMSTSYIDKFVENIDIIQVGARNMQNFDLLKELGKVRKPILLKRGLSSTIEELLMSAEYIMAQGNNDVILCERGIRTFETYTRNTLDLSAILVIKKQSHLPIVIDPSHATGYAWMVEPLALAAIAAGADGLIIEVHNDPPHALCDGQQSLTPAQFDAFMKKANQMAPLFNKEI